MPSLHRWGPLRGDSLLSADSAGRLGLSESRLNSAKGSEFFATVRGGRFDAAESAFESETRTGFDNSEFPAAGSSAANFKSSIAPVGELAESWGIPTTASRGTATNGTKIRHVAIDPLKGERMARGTSMHDRGGTSAPTRCAVRPIHNRQCGVGNGLPLSPWVSGKRMLAHVHSSHNGSCLL